MLDANDRKEIEKLISLETRKTYVKRVGDNPNDSLQLVPRKYTDLAVTTNNRPASVVSLSSQQFFNLTTGYPWFFNPNSSVWVSGTGSVVGTNL